MLKTMMAGLCLLAAAPVAAQTISARNPAQILSALQEMGYRAEPSVDDHGAPMISSAASGVNFEIYFYDCSGASNCDSLLFSAGFDMEHGISPAKVNEWNATRVGGQAYRDDEDDPFIDYFILTEGGVTPENFRASVKRWDRTLGDFIAFIDW